MRGAIFIRFGIILAVLGMLAVNCENPMLPAIQIVNPEKNAVYITDGSLDLDVEVRVPVQTCGTQSYPANPDTLEATLSQVLDGVDISVMDVTADLGDEVLDPATGTYAWTGTLNLPDYGDYELHVTINNSQGQGGAKRNIRLEQDVVDYEGGDLSMHITSLKQSPADCLIPNLAIGTVLGQIRSLPFNLTLPSGAAIQGGGQSATIELPSPMSPVDVGLSLDEANNDILIDGPDDYVMDITGMAPIGGYDCILTGSLDGVIDDIDPYDPDGSLSILITDVTSSGTGSCSLSVPSSGCTWTMGMDGDPI